MALDARRFLPAARRALAAPSPARLPCCACHRPEYSLRDNILAHCLHLLAAPLPPDLLRPFVRLVLLTLTPAGTRGPVNSNPAAGTRRPINSNPAAGTRRPVNSNPAAGTRRPVNSNPAAGTRGPVNSNPAGSPPCDPPGPLLAHAVTRLLQLAASDAALLSQTHLSLLIAALLRLAFHPPHPHWGHALDSLLALYDAPTLLRSFLSLLLNHPPQWLRSILAQRLSTLLLQQHGVLATLSFFLTHNTPDPDPLHTTRSLDATTKLLTTPPSFLSPNDFYKNILAQLLSILSSNNPQILLHAAVYAISHLFTQSPHAVHSVIIAPLQLPFQNLNILNPGFGNLPNIANIGLSENLPNPVLSENLLNPVLSQNLNQSENLLLSQNLNQSENPLLSQNLNQSENPLLSQNLFILQNISNFASPALSIALFTPIQLPLWYLSPINSLSQPISSIFVQLIKISGPDLAVFLLDHVADITTNLDNRIKCFQNILKASEKDVLSTVFLHTLKYCLSSRDTNKYPLKMMAYIQLSQWLIQNYAQDMSKCPHQLLEIIRDALTAFTAHSLVLIKDQDDTDVLSVSLSLLSSILSDYDSNGKDSSINNDIIRSFQPILRKLVQNPDFSATASTLLHLIDNPTPSSSRYLEALGYISNDEIPVKAQGLHILRSMVMARDPCLDISTILDIYLTVLHENESFLYLNAIKCLVEVAEKYDKQTIRRLLDIYADSSLDLEYRLRMGQVLSSLIERLGSILIGENAELIGSVIIRVLAQPDQPPSLHVSASSLFGIACLTNCVGMSMWIDNAVHSALVLLNLDSQVSVKRACLVLLSDILKTVDWTGSLALNEIKRVLVYIQNTEKDDSLRQLALDVSNLFDNTALSNLNTLEMSNQEQRWRIL